MICMLHCCLPITQCVLYQSDSTSPLHCSLSQIIKNHFGMVHVSKWLLVCCIFCTISKAELSYRLFFDAKGSESRMRSQGNTFSPKINMALTFLPSVLGETSHLTGSFCLLTLLSFIPTPPTSTTTWLKFKMSSESFS